ncbi:MAG: hypothetical protein AABZ39_00840 [Spirochaetota bacterium]
MEISLNRLRLTSAPDNGRPRQAVREKEFTLTGVDKQLLEKLNREEIARVEKSADEQRSYLKSLGFDTYLVGYVNGYGAVTVDLSSTSYGFVNVNKQA